MDICVGCFGAANGDCDKCMRNGEEDKKGEKDGDT